MRTIKKSFIKKLLAIGVLFLFFGANATLAVGARDWVDSFDTYQDGQLLDGTADDGGWRGWDSNPEAAGMVSSDYSRSYPFSDKIWDLSDNIHEYDGYTIGQWVYTAWQYIPSDFTGQTYFILLSDYIDGGGSANLWAVQMRFDNDLGVVESEFDYVTLPLIKGQWVEIRVEINLDLDWFQCFYGGDLLIEKAWTATPNNDGSGILNIACVDLYANSATSVYYDDMSLVYAGEPTELFCDAGGPYTAEVYEEIQFNGFAYGGTSPYTWAWDFGDDTTSTLEDPTHAYTATGVYNVTLTVTDADSNTTSDTTTATIYKIPEPPGTPVISGPTNGTIDTSYAYTVYSNDPDGDDVYYYIRWGDGSHTNWIGPYLSGQHITTNHSWDRTGMFTIQVKAMDIYGLESDWSDPIYMTITAPILTLSNITGGIGRVSCNIKNIGGENATNIVWTISLDGKLVFLGKESTDTIVTLAVGTEEPIKTEFILGFGKTNIIISATCDEGVSMKVTKTAFVLGPIVLGVK